MPATYPKTGEPVRVIMEDSSDKTRQRQVLAKLVQQIIRRRMAAPALFVLESAKPLSFVASQALIFFQPIIQTMLSVKDYETFALAIEDRDNIEWMIQQLEAAEEARACGQTTQIGDDK